MVQDEIRRQLVSNHIAAIEEIQLGGGADPPVYHYVEGSGPPTLAWPSFSGYVADAIRWHTRASGGSSAALPGE